MTHKKKTTILTLAFIGALLVVFIILAATSKPRYADQLENTETVQLPEEEAAPLDEPEKFTYIKIIDSCGPYYGGPCVNVRSGPGTDFPKVLQLRNGVVLRVSDAVKADGHIWYKIVFKEWLRYPERVTGDWYVAGDFVEVYDDEKPADLVKGMPATKKRVVVLLSEQKLYAFDGTELFMETAVSTGKEGTPTDPGTFTVFRKTPSRYMQGPLPGSDDVYDLPGVPWSMYFTADGAVIHGAYWHDNFGQHASHGCINLPPDLAEELYRWAELGMKVIIKA